MGAPFTRPHPRGARAGAVAALACLACGSAQWPQLRSLVLISIDTLRADRLGCYGYERDTSPHIDGLAAEGVRFTNAASAASTTLTSHTSLMTGTWPHTHGVARNGCEVPDENVMLAEVLRGHGFRTAAFVGAAPLDAVVRFDQGFEIYDSRYSVEASIEPERRAEEVTDAVLGWLDRERPKKRLFLFAHYYDCHAPYAPPAPFTGLFLPTIHSMSCHACAAACARATTPRSTPPRAIWKPTTARRSRTSINRWVG